MRNRAGAVTAVIVLLCSCAGDDQPPPVPSMATPGPEPSSTGPDRPTSPDEPLVGVTEPATRTATESPTSTTQRSSTAPATTTESPRSTPTSDRVDVPYVAFELPAGWNQGPTAVSTEFAAGADCVAATVVDLEPPTDPAAEGEAGFTLRSTVQVCARPADGDALTAYLTAIYGDLSGFEPVEIGGVQGYRSTTGAESVTFVQTDEHRFQVLTSVAADLTLERERLSQVEDIVATMAFE